MLSLLFFCFQMYRLLYKGLSKEIKIFILCWKLKIYFFEIQPGLGLPGYQNISLSLLGLIYF